MAPVGFTTGGGSKIYILSEVGALEEIVEKYKLLGANAVELHFQTLAELIDAKTTPKLVETLNTFEYVSIHMPRNVRYTNQVETMMMLEKVKRIQDEITIHGAVIHPDLIDIYEPLEQSGIPFLIENMDKRKIYGSRPEHIASIRERCSFGFVLDIQHAYEQDSTMTLCKELIDIMGDRLQEFHVSGCTDSQRHVLVHIAENRTEISQILQHAPPVPKILEGVLSQNVTETIRTEIEYVRAFERKNL